jgi:predicted nucleic acid-binding protein
MRILIDTNILIHLEDNKVISEPFAKFYQLAISNKCDLYYHPACLRDIKKDKQEERQKITLSKLNKYVQMPDPAVPSTEFTALVGQNKENDEIDNSQLFQVFKEYVDFFVTEDSGILTKARKINLSDKVLSLAEGLKLLQEKYTLIIPKHPLLQECSTREIEKELNDEFFNSLREGYSGFNNWFIEKCARQNRHCYVLRIDNKISAILIFHREKSADHNLPGINNDAMKMCTLKVAETVFGYRLGELFLNKMFDMCIKGKINHLYLTVFPQHIHLITLLEKYGFVQDEFKNKDGLDELRMIKSLVKSDYAAAPQAVTAHPFYTDGTAINKFVVPIDPKFYNTLFKDGTFRQQSLFDNTSEALNEIEGNTISKAYLCKSKRKNMKAGDLLFFYGSKNIKSIEPVGVLDEVVYTKDIDEIKKLVRRKTVYSDTDLEQMARGKQAVTVLIFRLLYYLESPVKFQSIKTLESYTNNFQTITTLTETDYNHLKQNKHFDERFIIN